MTRALLFMTIALMAPAPSPQRDEPAPIDRVEEDWSLTILSPDIPAAGPQITTTMNPGTTDEHPIINFNLNYRDRPTFNPGGLQIQVWDGDTLLGLATSGSDSLNTDGETITWTQRLSISGGHVEFRVESGHSTTWGDFGGESLSIHLDTNLSDLGSYDPALSASKSGVGWQSDHVTSMQLVRVRYYVGETLVRTDESPRTIVGAENP